jgi:putative aldouronate transport system permease protein
MDKGQKAVKKSISLRKFKNNIPLHLMMLPGVILVLIFCYFPMYGIIIAFQRFVPAKGLFGSQEWVGFDNFEVLFRFPQIWTYLKNTVEISLAKIVLSIVTPLVFALLLNEIRIKWFKKSVQTIVYFPYFLSWVVFGGIVIDVLSPSTGIINNILGLFGGDPIYFLGDTAYVKGTIIWTDIFKTFGFNTIIYLAAITGINTTLYEAAAIDGANRLQQTRHVTIPGIIVIVALMSVLSMGNILNAGFEQIWNLINPNTMSEIEILDTFIYRQGILARQYGLGAAVGLMKSVVSMAFMGTSYFIAYKFLDYKLF